MYYKTLTRTVIGFIAVYFLTLPNTAAAIGIYGTKPTPSVSSPGCQVRDYYICYGPWGAICSYYVTQIECPMA